MKGRFEVCQELRDRLGRKEFKARCKLTGEEAFLECIDKQWLAENRLYSRQKTNALKTAATLSHPGFLRVLDYFHDELNYYITSEWADGGSIHHLIKKKGSLKEHLVLWFMVNLIESMAFSHSKGVIMGNFSSRNIFIKDSLIKIGILDNSITISEVSKTNIPANGHSLSISPEVLRGQNLSFKADLWSLGVVLFEMMYGTPPLLETTLAKLKQSFETFKFVNKETESNPSRWLLSSLLEGLLIVDDSKRWSMPILLSRLPEVKALLECHALIGLKIDINAIEYHCDPVLARIDSVSVKDKLTAIQNLVELTHQTNHRFKSDPNLGLKWARLEFKWMINLLQYTRTSSMKYQKKLENSISLFLLNESLALLIEYERLLARFSGPYDERAKMLKNTSDEKCLLLSLFTVSEGSRQLIDRNDGLQR
jgi:serine/threonine protein kinase